MAGQRQERWLSWFRPFCGSGPGITFECSRVRERCGAPFAFTEMSQPHFGVSTGMNLEPMSRTLSRCFNLIMAAIPLRFGGGRMRASGAGGLRERLAHSALCEPQVRSRESARRPLQGPSNNLGLSTGRASGRDHRRIRNLAARSAIRKERKAGCSIRFFRDGARLWSRHGRRASNSILYSKANPTSAPVAKLQSNVIASVRSCDGAWCRISGEGFDGYIEQSKLWGVYPNEKIE